MSLDCWRKAGIPGDKQNNNFFKQNITKKHTKTKQLCTSIKDECYSPDETESNLKQQRGCFVICSSVVPSVGVDVKSSIISLESILMASDVFPTVVLSYIYH